MNDELKELISKADCGDSDAQKELMTRGDAASEAGDHEQAAYLYKMAAMAYRIAASRTDGILTDTARTAGRFARTIRLYDEWVKKYTRPLAPRINRLALQRLAGDASNCILHLRRDKEFAPLVRHLEDELGRHGIEWCAPGGTINRHFYYMIRKDTPFSDFMHDIDIRIALDPICDEVLRRLKK